jgi:hypothetical protein
MRQKFWVFINSGLIMAYSDRDKLSQIETIKWKGSCKRRSAYFIDFILYFKHNGISSIKVSLSNARGRILRVKTTEENPWVYLWPKIFLLASLTRRLCILVYVFSVSNKSKMVKVTLCLCSVQRLFPTFWCRNPGAREK